MRMRGYPRWFYTALMVTIAILVVTGGLLAPTAFELRLEWEVPWRLAADHHIIVAALHAAISFLMLAMVGALWSVHMRAGWKRKRSLYTGIGLLFFLGALGFTAIGIYYLGDDKASVISSVAHMCLGAALPLLLAIHDVIGRRYHVIFNQ